MRGGSIPQQPAASAAAEAVREIREAAGISQVKAVRL